MVTSVGYAYPWDLVDGADGVRALGDLGVQAVAIAAAYHGVSAATPRRRDRRVFVAPTSALYLPVRNAAWRGGRLTPRPADAWAGADAFGRARDATHAGGLPVLGWIVVTHRDDLAEVAPDLAVVNAFGERLGYAACPARAEVRDAAGVLAAEVAGAGVDGLVAEAVGWLGIDHAGLHDKVGGAGWPPAVREAASVCLCGACTVALAERGVDPAELGAALRGIALDPAETSFPACLETVLPGAAEAVAAHRRTTVARVVDAVRDSAATVGVHRVGFHATPDPFTTSAAAPISEGGLLVAPCWDPTPNAGAAVRALAEEGAPVGAFVTILPPVEPDALEPHLRRLVDAGVDEVHLYHAGLAAPDRIDAAAQALRRITPAR